MIDLPVIRQGLIIGRIDLEKREVIPNQDHPIYFTCKSRVDCCSTMQIPASEYDIERIMDHGYELDQIIRDASPIFLNPNSQFGPRHKAYILKTKPFDGTCTFLEDNLCAIHQFKPFACKIYPFALEFADDKHLTMVIHQDQLCESITAVKPAESNNRELLDNMMTTILQELEDRGYDNLE